jgi:hypothetical protein
MIFYFLVGLYIVILSCFSDYKKGVVFNKFYIEILAGLVTILFWPLFLCFLIVADDKNVN